MSTILANFSALLIGFFLYLFFYWRNLKEDYKSQPVFDSGIVIFASTVILGLIFEAISNFLPESYIYDRTGLWFWGGAIGYLLAFLYTKQKFKFRHYEHFQASSIPLFVIIFLSFVIDFIVNMNSNSLFGALFVFILWIVYIFLQKNYRKFTWYKSGRFGFAALMTYGVFFFARTLIALTSTDVISSAGKIDVILSGIVSFIFFFNVYLLSEK